LQHFINMVKNNSIKIKKPCFIIAEAGVNHNGSLKLAKKLINKAGEIGVDAIKFQTFKSEDLVIEKSKMADYQKKNIGKNESQLEMLKKLELSEKEFIELKKYCDRKKIIFLSTPHTEKAIDFLEPLVPVYKIASGDLTNLPFLEKVAKKQKPIILSTGMADLKEIEEVIEIIKKNKNNKIFLLHCTTDYPCPTEEVNLRAILTLQQRFNLPVGYSDHTKSTLISIVAVSLGAKIIEKHFTLDKKLLGPDHKASLIPNEFRKMVKEIRIIEKAMGSGIKKPTKNEEKIKKLMRKSVVAKTDIPKGTRIQKEMIIIKRPGIGIEPKFFNKIIGKKTKKNIKKDQLISWQML